MLLWNKWYFFSVFASRQSCLIVSRSNKLPLKNNIATALKMMIRQWCVLITCNRELLFYYFLSLNPLFTVFVPFYKITFSGVLTTFEELMQTCFKTENYLPEKDVIFRKWWGKGLYKRNCNVFCGRLKTPFSTDYRCVLWPVP